MVATTTDAADDAIAVLCRREQLDCFRGHPRDLLDRHCQAAREFDATAVVKIPWDCPLVDPRVIDRDGGLAACGGSSPFVNWRGC